MQTGNITFGFVEGVAAVKVGAYGDLEAAAVDVGRTIGGVQFQMDREVKEINTDQDHGPVGAKEVKRVGKIKFKLAESSLANLAIALNLPTTAVTTGVLAGGAPAGGELYRTVYLNVDGPSGGTRKYRINKAVISGGAQSEFKKDEPTAVEIELMVLWDNTQTAGEEMFRIDDTASDTTAPVVALSTPADGGTVTKNTKGTVTWTFTEANQIDASSLVYGKSVLIVNTTTPASAALVAGALAYDRATKTMTFTPTNNWTASDTFQVMVTTAVKDVNGNPLAAPKIEQFSVTP